LDRLQAAMQLYGEAPKRNVDNGGIQL